MVGIVNGIKIVMLLMCVIAVCAVSSAQNCEQSHTYSSQQLISYLNDIAPEQRFGRFLETGKSECVAYAIKRLDDEKTEAAIPVLVKFLEFRWPLDSHGMVHRVTHSKGGDTRYPAELALERFHEKALPSVLEQIKNGNGSNNEIDSAVAVWMVYYEKQAVRGVALLKQEADKAKDPAARHRLNYAAYLAQRKWCERSETDQCMQAAMTTYSTAPK